MMPDYFIHIWLFFFAVFAREIKYDVKTGLYSRVTLTGELDQLITDSVKTVEWTKQNSSVTCLCFRKMNTTFSASYSQCCGTVHFYLNNNSLILENVTAKDEGVFTESIVTGNGTIKRLNFTLILQYPPNVTAIAVSWTSSTSVTLKCEVSGSFLHLMWKRGVPILEKHRHSFSERNQTLHISNITSSDYGMYSCIASNADGQSEKHTYITDENSTVNQGNGAKNKTESDQIVLSSGLTLTGVLGLCIVFFCLYKYHHRQREENGRTTEEGGADNDVGVYQEIAGTEEATPLPYVYTDFIKPKESSQASAAGQHFEEFGYSEVGPTSREEAVVLKDFGYSEVGPTSREENVVLKDFGYSEDGPTDMEEPVVLGEHVSNKQFTACPDAEEE